MKPKYDVRAILDNLNLEADDIGGELQGTCPMHRQRTGKNDSNPSWYINLSTGLHICFSCGYKGNLLSLVKDVRGIDAAQAMSVLVGNREGDTVRDERVAYLPPALGGPTSLPESSLALFDMPPPWVLEGRQLDEQSCRRFGVLWDITKSAWILPIRDEDGLLHGWQVKGEGTRHFRNHPRGVQKSLSLFGYHLLQQVQRPVIVVESPLDAVRLGRLGYPAVAVYGAKISEHQADLLAKLPSLILALDADAAGRKATDAYLQHLHRGGEYFLIKAFGAGKDFGDLSDDDEVHALIAEAQPSWGEVRV